MLMSAKALLDQNPSPTRKEIVDFMSGNLCRCGTYEEVTEAIQSVGRRGGKE
jgi:carbon-monoxide dehydrogenase small subunit